MTAVVIEQKHGGGTITGVLSGKIGVLWCGLVGISTLAGFTVPCSSKWREWIKANCGFSADLAFFLSCKFKI